MNRRSFLSALSALPLAGRWFPGATVAPAPAGLVSSSCCPTDDSLVWLVTVTYPDGRCWIGHALAKSPTEFALPPKAVRVELSPLPGQDL